MLSPEEHKAGPDPDDGLAVSQPQGEAGLPANLKYKPPLRWGDLLLPILLFIAFATIGAVITITDTAPAYGGYLAIMFVGLTYPLPWARISYGAAMLSSLALFYWFSNSLMSQQDAMAGLIISLVAVWAIAFAISHIQYLEGQVDTRDKQLDLAMDASDLGIFHWDLKTNRVYAHGKLRELWGLPSDGPIYSSDIVSRVHEDDSRQVQLDLGRALRGEGEYNSEFRIRDRRTGRVRWLLGRGQVIQAVRSRRLYMTGTNLDITSLKEEQMRIRSILDGLGVLAGLLTTDGELIEANSRALETADLNVDDVIGKPFWETYWWSHDRIEQTRLQEAIARARDGETVEYDATIRVAEDEYATIAFFLSPVIDSQGTVTYLVPSAVNITERKRAEEQINLLMQELNHRIKNLFSVTNALINLSARHATDVDSFVQSTMQRLRALHASHTMTGASVSEATSFYKQVDAERLAEKAVAPYSLGQKERIHIESNGMVLDTGQATAFSLILNELAANSVKHGSLSADGGKVSIVWKPDAGGGFTFDWREAGGPPVGKLDGRGFGHSIMSLLTRNYLDGEAVFGADESGFTFEITSAPEPENGAAGGAEDGAESSGQGDGATVRRSAE
ncbi:sensor histidine kinase [Aquisalinus flavus]|uniref:histidine kinase n=1 Tax=Aquisalinus flavus TaxID=1526572 RepID=A0A8J2V2W4_9PROT|nr:PAS domain S-box protein [Aquisalinus flavus]MBD0425522.1 PAS domain S-box protein [Aquisalinus flavus]UNE48848.1 PAS domain S-box protein [Aquisalinus flavus]GGD15387.1 hypothetical protein GCM10011342_25210 [Aquisalinus flavus]